jgi:hypothetical protein
MSLRVHLLKRAPVVGVGGGVGGGVAGVVVMALLEVLTWLLLLLVLSCGNVES